VAINIPTFEPSKTALDRVSEQTRDAALTEPHGMFNYLRVNNPDHILVSGKRANQIGTVLYGFEHLNRDVTAAELAAQLGLAEKQVTNAISKINAIINPVFGVKIERVKMEGSYTGKLRLTQFEDALQAKEAYTKKMNKVGPEFLSSLESLKNNGGDINQIVQGSDMASLMGLVEFLAPALPAAADDVEQEVES